MPASGLEGRGLAAGSLGDSQPLTRTLRIRTARELELRPKIQNADACIIGLDCWWCLDQITRVNVEYHMAVDLNASSRNVLHFRRKKLSLTKPTQNFRAGIFSYAAVVSYKLCHKEL